MKRKVAFGAGVAALGLLFALTLHGQDEKKPIQPEEPGACLACHGGEGFAVPLEKGGSKSLFVDGNKFAKSAHRDLTCVECHAGTEKVPHVRSEITPANCADCHSEEDELLQQSIHGVADSRPGRPNCIGCHEQNPHAVLKIADWNRDQRLAGCYDCHSNAAHMKPFGIATVAAYSYKRSFHGKAHFYGSNKTAVCSDCHGSHNVLAVTNPRSMVSAKNATQTCGKCHKGSAPAFALSGVSHLDLKIKESAVLKIELWFFLALLYGVLAILILSVLLDLRVGLRLSYRRWKRSLREEEAKKRIVESKFGWYTPWQITQHWIFAASFFVLVGTGLPLRFPEVHWLNSLMALLGGLESSRQIHRVAGGVMTAMFVTHVLWLLWSWRKINFSIKRIPMLPNRHDWEEFKQMMAFYLGKYPTPPKFGLHGRFSYRVKFGYLVEYWGVPIMALSGLVLAFPVEIGNRLGNLGVSMAYIAHGYEATLAAGSVLIWHIYTTVISPTEDELRRQYREAAEQ